MSIEEKTGQLFFLIIYEPDVNYIEKLTNQIHAGGVMCRVMSREKVVETVSLLQRGSTIPMLIAANLEAGGNGICSDGTKVGSQMMVAATGNKKYGASLGAICAEEGLSVGANYAFAPIVDIDYNFRNPITNTRTFGSSPDTVLHFASEYMRECQKRGVACSIKHFPGDGRDERDQHLCTTVNDFSVEDWDRTYGNIYKTLIDQGAKTVMVGHIMQPAYAKLLNPSLSDEQILPASLSKELLNNLLREKFGFNGLIISDATTMAGFDAAMPRDKAVPYSIAAGCDMFLFSKNLDEDYAYMRQGIDEGVITQERLDEAVARILALKASLKLHEKDNIPNGKNAQKTLGCAAHKQVAKEVADKSIALVKNKQNILPLDKKKIKNILIYDIESGENALGYVRSLGVYEQIEPLLKKEGFNVTRFVPNTGKEGKTARYSDTVENYDLILYLCNLATKSNQTTVRIEWMNPMGVNVPRFVKSVPTIFVSTENPYHLLDVPMVKTYINTYGMNEYTVPCLVDKLLGRSKFTAQQPVDAFCGKWDTRI
ncbi:MAG: glycoside hydrolase family 3 protein [Clostridiales bacterium]|nr:glycoside hydrolase family 3 protein [Clostridiales bacterium]